MVCIETCPTARGIIPKPKASIASEWRAMEDDPRRILSAAVQETRKPKTENRNRFELIETGELGRGKRSHY
jgi:hypothetical protein